MYGYSQKIQIKWCVALKLYQGSGGTTNSPKINILNLSGDLVVAICIKKMCSKRSL